jgi:hypothetical protein
MFLNRQYRARAIGILAAYAVVITGILIGVIRESSSNEPTPQVSTESRETRTIEVYDCSTRLQDRPDSTC